MKKKNVHIMIQKILTTMLLVAVFFFSIPDVERIPSALFSGAAKHAEATANYGKETRTAEFILGGGSDRAARATGVLTYADPTGTWPTIKPTMGSADLVTLTGNHIHVLSAALDISYALTAGTAHVYDNRVTLDVEGAPSAGTDLPVGDVVGSGNAATTPLIANSGSIGYLNTIHDVTPLFSAQTDADFQNGVSVILGVQATLAAGSRAWTTARLSLTYEVDAPDGSDSNYSLVKTVRLPLDSTTGTDAGTRQADCAANASCAFQFSTASLPDLAATSDIESAYIELSARQNAAATTTFTIQHNGGAISSSFALNSFAAGGRHATRVFHSLSPSDFTLLSSQTISIANGATSQALQALGGEVVITYRYKTNAPSQAETISYFLHQGLVNPGTATTTMGSVVVDIANSGATPMNAWMRVKTSPVTATAVLGIVSQVGTAPARTKAYSLPLATRAGNTPTIYQDMTADIGSMGTSTSITGAYRFGTTGNPPVSVEVVCTFVWDGAYASPRTKTISFPASQQSAPRNITNAYVTRTAPVYFAEEGDKIIESSYVDVRTHRTTASASVTASVTTNVEIGTTNTAIPDVGTSEAYRVGHLVQIPSTFFSSGTTFTDTRFYIPITQSIANTNFALFANSINVTYSVTMQTPSQMERQVRTVEYVLGGGTSATTFASAATAYVGASWGTTKPAAENVIITGSNVHVVSAMLDTQFQLGAVPANITAMSLTGDATLTSGNITNQKLLDIFGDTTNVYQFNSGVTSGVGTTVGFRRQFDVTGLLSQQTTDEWNAGVGVLFGLNVTLSSAQTRQLSAAKLIITYESDLDFNRIGGRDETKTVRFPIRSSVVGDTGTRAGSCAVVSCDFNYFADMPDWSGIAADILSVHYEMSATLGATTASNIGMTVNGASSGARAWTEAFNDFTTMQFYWAPPVVTSGFVPNTTQTLNFTNGAGIYYGVGGEVVVTYRYNSGQAVQTETVQYAMNQVTASAQNGSLGSVTATILNSEAKISSVWMKVQHPLNTAATITLNGKVGTAATTTKGYLYGAADNLRGSGFPTIYHDLSAATSTMGTSTTVTGTYGYSTATNITTYLNVELYVTFTWTGNKGGPMTRTTLFPASQNGIHNISGRPRARTVNYVYPKGIANTFHDGYVMQRHAHTASSAGNITVTGVITSWVNGLSTAVTEGGDTEVYQPSVLQDATGVSLFGATTSPAYALNAFELVNTEAIANKYYSTGIFYNTYTEQHTFQQPTFDQKNFWLFVDNDALLPSDPWSSGTPNLAENGEMTFATRPIRSGEHVRLRMNLLIGTTTLATSTYAFQLEYAPKVTSCSAATGWTTVDGAGGSSMWKGYAATPVTGTSLSTNPPVGGDLLLANSNIPGTYEEGGVSALNPFAVNVGEYIEYDWNIMHNGATKETAYCFRMVESNGDLLRVYDYYPVLTASPYVAETKDWQWYDDTASTPLALKNVAPPSVANNDIIKLRIDAKEVANESDTNLRFALQWSTDSVFSGGGAMVTSLGDCTQSSVFCYTDGYGADDSVIPSSLLGAYSLGRYNEATSTSTFSPGALSDYEMEFSIKPVRQLTGQVYYFRLFDTKRNLPVVYNAGYSYPSIVAEGATLGATISGIPENTLIAGATTSASTTSSSLPFGTLTANISSYLAHHLNIRSNAASGYMVSVQSIDDVRNEYGDIIPPITHTNAVPGSWSTGCSPQSLGCFGYHTTDTTLFGASSRFAPSLWAGMSSTTPGEIGYGDFPTTPLGEDIDVLYRVEPQVKTSAGTYGTDLLYIITPVY